jgi:hypothetical protein
VSPRRAPSCLSDESAARLESERPARAVFLSPRRRNTASNHLSGRERSSGRVLRRERYRQDLGTSTHVSRNNAPLFAVVAKERNPEGSGERDAERVAFVQRRRSRRILGANAL